MSKYKITHVVELETDPDGDFDTLEFTPTGELNYIKPEALKELKGWTVEKIETLDTDPVGTVRKYDISGNYAFKAPDGKWRYLAESVQGGCEAKLPDDYRIGDEVPSLTILRSGSTVVKLT